MKTRVSLLIVSLFGLVVALETCLGPESAPKTYEKGIRHLDRGDVDAALAAFDQALVIDPRFAQAYCARGSAYEKKGEDEKAIDDFTHAIRLKPNYEVAYRNRGNVYVYLGDARQACADFIKATWISIEATRGPW
jgi:tetratricopeptide (TPR) repeat protein